MATNAHVQVRYQVRQADVPRDYCIHSLYFSTQAGPVAPNQWQELTDHVSATMFSKTGFGGTQPWYVYGGRAGTVTAYDLADPKPRPEKAVTTYAPTSWESGSLGPRMIASCLSYYSGRNLPHTRGRIYLGPFLNGSMGETVPTQLLQQIQDLGHGLFSIALQGTIAWAHSTHSTVTNLTNVVTNYWTNDVWDVQHSREHSELTRLRYP